MASPREQLEGESLGQLADRMQYGAKEDLYHPAVAELERRKALWQRDSAKAEQDAAATAKSTAEYAEKTAQYILWSVLAILLTSGFSALFFVSFLGISAPLNELLSHFQPRR
jgi:hypothetical protein